jgi:SAM-dependent methyltransferase
VLASRHPQEDPAARTLRDFGAQWLHDGGNEGFYGSLELLRDLLGPLVSEGELRGARIADVGSGTGRIVRMLLAAGAEHVTALEPSRGVEVLRHNCAEFGNRVRVLEARGEELPPGLGLDFVTAIGVLPFVPEPEPLLRAARAALRPGGRIVVWLYAAEQSLLARSTVAALRRAARSLPRGALAPLCTSLDHALDFYVVACRYARLPLRDYMLGVFARLSREKRRLTLYDQLNPSYVRYYARGELAELLAGCGFGCIRIHDRHGYSWTAVGTRSSA